MIATTSFSDRCGPCTLGSISWCNFLNELWEKVKCVAKMKSDDNHHSATEQVLSIYSDSNQLVKHSPLINPCWLFQMTSLSFMFIATASLRAHFVLCSGTDLKLMDLLFPRPSLWDMGIYLCFSSHSGFALISMTFQRWNSMTLQCCQSTWHPQTHLTRSHRLEYVQNTQMFLDSPLYSVIHSLLCCCFLALRLGG